jgi:hypothetical protein
VASLLRVTPKSRPPQLKADAGREEREGRLPQAIRLLERVLRLTPEDWPTVRRLADLRARQGSGPAAADLYVACYGEAAGHRNVAARLRRLRAHAGQRGGAPDVSGEE